MANTPFLNLVKPTDTDQALITDINNNSDKIDTGVSTLSEQIATVNGSLNSISPDVSEKDAYTGDVFSAPAGFRRCSSSATNIPLTENGYILMVIRGQTNKALTYISDSNRMFTVTNAGGTWRSWQELTTRSDTYFARAVTAGISSGGTLYLNHTGSVMLMTDRGGLWTEGSLGRTLKEIDSNANITVTRESNTKLKIVSSYTYSTQLTAFGYGEQLSFSTT